MAEYAQPHKESHVRSIIKGLTWRVVAMLDTFVVALIVTWIVFGEPRFEASGWIMLVETPIKLITYYLHERIWQSVWKNHLVGNREILLKTISWRIFATIMTFVIALNIFEFYDKSNAVTSSLSNSTVAFLISIVELISKSVLYFFHEKVWLRVKLGRVRRMYKRLKSRL